ncbi:hypothetical protein DB891_15400 [Flavobacterium laiguense]|uniref:Uncharacterized protein n=1 Tax=Flavobacterium laiguense TaxID=2169409 RepID=A0A2U1JNL6_9FLAO|nr:hypothetical protein DB891_15400 [Flavobacterium laiguense]
MAKYLLFIANKPHKKNTFKHVGNYSAPRIKHEIRVEISTTEQLQMSFLSKQSIKFGFTLKEGILILIFLSLKRPLNQNNSFRIWK